MFSEKKRTRTRGYLQNSGPEVPKPELTDALYPMKDSILLVTSG